MEELRFPIGRFSAPDPVTSANIDNWIEEIAALPAELREVLAKLPPEGMRTPCRPGGWTPVKVLHHLVDSHMNSHPEYGEDIDLATNIGIYAWHGRHHLAHVKLVADRTNSGRRD